MVFYAAFNSISVISQKQLALFMSFLGFTSTRLGLWSVLPKGTPMKKPRESSVARTQDPWITSKHFTTETMQDPWNNPFPHKDTFWHPWKLQNLASTKLKVFAISQIYIAQTIISVFDMIENSVEKGEVVSHQHFFFFHPQCLQKAFFLRVLNLLPNKLLFLCVCSTSLLKTLWEKEKLVVTSNFSFSHSAFYPFGQLSSIFIKLKIAIWKLYWVWESVKFVVWGRVKTKDVVHPGFIGAGLHFNDYKKWKHFLLSHKVFKIYH